MKVAAETTARIEDAHPGRNPAAQQLIEQVNVDLAELLSKGRQNRLFQVVAENDAAFHDELDAFHFRDI